MKTPTAHWNAIVLVAVAIGMGPVDARAGYYDEDCFPMIASIEAMIVAGILTETVTVEEWTICEGAGAGGLTSVSTPPGGDDLARIVALVQEFNAGGGLDYEVVQHGSGGIGVRPEQPGLAITGVPVTLDGSDVTVGAADRAVFDQLLAERNVWIGPPALPADRDLQPVSVSANASLAEALIQIQQAAFPGVKRRWNIRVWPQGAAFRGFRIGPNDPQFVFVDAPSEPDCTGNTSPACVGSCGDGEVSAILPAPPCPNPAATTLIASRADLDAWLEAPTTTADIREDIDFGGNDLVIATQCDLITRSGDDLTGIGAAFLSARNVDIGGSIGATEAVTLRASALVITRQAGAVVDGPAVAIEAPTVDVRADMTTASVCMEGGTVISRQASHAMSGGAVAFYGDTLDIHGDFTGAARFDATSANNLVIRQAATVDAEHTYLFAGGLLDMHGDYSGTGSFTAEAGQLYFRQAAVIDGAASVSLSSTGPTAAEWRGEVRNIGQVTLATVGDLFFRQSGALRDSGAVTWAVGGHLDGRGTVTGNGAVDLDASTYYLSNSNDFTGNASCEIAGTATSGSKPANGCTETP